MNEEIIMPLIEYLHRVNDFHNLDKDSKLYNLSELWGVFKEDGYFIIVQSKLNKNSHMSLNAINHKNREIEIEDSELALEEKEFNIKSEYTGSFIKAYCIPLKEIIPFYKYALIGLNTCFKLETEINNYLDEKLINYEDMLEKKLKK